jgi:hypothetical protein
VLDEFGDQIGALQAALVLPALAPVDTECPLDLRLGSGDVVLVIFGSIIKDATIRQLG